MTENNWWKKEIVYQIYPRSFKDSNGDGVGDLQGILEKLDYFTWLGVGAIWLSPIYKSPMVDFGYDIADYCDIDPLFGSMADFEKLVHEAHARNIKIVMDFVPNHTSNLHPWFLESKSSKDSPKRNWYIWADGKNGSPPNNWLSVFGGSGWEKDEVTGQYYYHSFAKEQPDLNWRDPEVKKAMFDVLSFWLKKGVDGFRVDAIYWLTKDEKLQDDPVNPDYRTGKEDPYHQLIHINSQGQDDTIKILGEICALLEQYPGVFMVTELHASVPIMAKYYRASNNGRHSPFNFNLIGMQWSAESFRKFVDEFEASLLPNDWPNYVLGNHDQPRVASRVGQDRARLLAMLQFTLRGMPFVYYGEELGMEDGIIPQQMAHDPFEKNLPGFKLGRDPERTPMQWDRSPHAGFSKASPWLPVGSGYHHSNVEVEKEDSRSMLSLYKKLISLRASTPALLEGSYRLASPNNECFFSFLREKEGEKYLVVLNFSEEAQMLNSEFAEGDVMVSSFLTRPVGESVALKNFLIQPYEGFVFKVK